MIQKTSIYSKRTILPGGEFPATVTIKNGKIISVRNGKHMPENGEWIDAGNDVLIPGLIDAHVHINEPGRTEWEGFDSATKAAAAGGITTLVDMPLNSSPVTCSPAALEQKMATTKGKLHVNCGFWGGLVPENAGKVNELMKSGVLGIKAFMTHSGIDEFPNVSEADLRIAMPEIAKSGLPLLVHAELDSPHPGIEHLVNNATSYEAYIHARPKSWEDEAISLLIRLCREFDCKTHIVHLSSANSISHLTTAKEEGMPITVETCPHYLYFNAEDIPDGDTRFKCAPPIREKANNEQLWNAIKTGLIDFIVTDHSPATPVLKELESGNLYKAWGGIASLQFSLPAVWSKAKDKGFTPFDISKLMSSNVAKFIGLNHRKGAIKAGYDADLVIWNPEDEFTVTPDQIYHKHKVTPYEGEKLKGVVEFTFVNGNCVYKNGEIQQRNRGKLILNS